MQYIFCPIIFLSYLLFLFFFFFAKRLDGLIGDSNVDEEGENDAGDGAEDENAKSQTATKASSRPRSSEIRLHKVWLCGFCVNVLCVFSMCILCVDMCCEACDSFLSLETYIFTLSRNRTLLLSWPTTRLFRDSRVLSMRDTTTSSGTWLGIENVNCV